MPLLLLLSILTATLLLQAGEVDMRDYNLLRRGMNEAEVIYRIGPPDHETVYNDYYGHIQRKVWYYIPERKSSRRWLSIITFDGHGIITELRRERP